MIKKKLFPTKAIAEPRINGVEENTNDYAEKVIYVPPEETKKDPAEETNNDPTEETKNGPAEEKKETNEDIDMAAIGENKDSTELEISKPIKLRKLIKSNRLETPEVCNCIFSSAICLAQIYEADPQNEGINFSKANMFFTISGSVFSFGVRNSNTRTRYIFNTKTIDHFNAIEKKYAPPECKDKNEMELNEKILVFCWGKLALNLINASIPEKISPPRNDMNEESFMDYLKSLKDEIMEVSYDEIKTVANAIVKALSYQQNDRWNFSNIKKYFVEEKQSYETKKRNEEIEKEQNKKKNKKKKGTEEIKKQELVVEEQKDASAIIDNQLINNTTKEYDYKELLEENKKLTEKNKNLEILLAKKKNELSNNYAKMRLRNEDIEKSMVLSPRHNVPKNNNNLGKVVSSKIKGLLENNYFYSEEKYRVLEQKYMEMDEKLHKWEEIAKIIANKYEEIKDKNNQLEREIKEKEQKIEELKKVEQKKEDHKKVELKKVEQKKDMPKKEEEKKKEGDKKIGNTIVKSNTKELPPTYQLKNNIGPATEELPPKKQMEIYLLPDSNPKYELIYFDTYEHFILNPNFPYYRNFGNIYKTIAYRCLELHLASGKKSIKDIKSLRLNPYNLKHLIELSDSKTLEEGLKESLLNIGKEIQENYTELPLNPSEKFLNTIALKLGILLVIITCPPNDLQNYVDIYGKLINNEEIITLMKLVNGSDKKVNDYCVLYNDEDYRKLKELK